MRIMAIEQTIMLNFKDTKIIYLTKPVRRRAEKIMNIIFLGYINKESNDYLK